MAGRNFTEGYTAKQVTAVTGVAYQTLNHWARAGLVEPSIARAAGHWYRTHLQLS
jgi:DNA-binding transcriptional MerR regulator